MSDVLQADRPPTKELFKARRLGADGVVEVVQLCVLAPKGIRAVHGRLAAIVTILNVRDGQTGREERGRTEQSDRAQIGSAGAFCTLAGWRHLPSNYPGSPPSSSP